MSMLEQTMPISAHLRAYLRDEEPVSWVPAREVAANFGIGLPAASRRILPLASR